MVVKNPPSFSNQLEMLQHIDAEKKSSEEKFHSQTEKLQSQIKRLQIELKAATAKKTGEYIMVVHMLSSMRRGV